ncbi:MAG: PLP-dependent transferase, partial [Acidimicrobiales bacterium]
PLELGADFVGHSATKLIAGHSDVLMGAVVARDAAGAAAMRADRTLRGAGPGPFEAFLALRGLRSLAPRLERAQANACALAERLGKHPAVERVRFPGLAGHPGHDLAASQMAGPGTMISFEVRGGSEAADACCESLSLCTVGTSLGGVETLIERRGRWAGEEHLPPSLLRLSVGIEHLEDLWEDLAGALDRLA